jgi:hypothetical protein
MPFGLQGFGRLWKILEWFLRWKLSLKKTYYMECNFILATVCLFWGLIQNQRIKFQNLLLCILSLSLFVFEWNARILVIENKFFVDVNNSVLIVMFRI